jgi:hypothetical protein
MISWSLLLYESFKKTLFRKDFPKINEKINEKPTLKKITSEENFVKFHLPWIL